MGAQPKNKISRVERGKRRRGNTKKHTKQVSHATIPAHKKSFVAAMFEKLGLTNPVIKK